MFLCMSLQPFMSLHFSTRYMLPERLCVSDLCIMCMLEIGTLEHDTNGGSSAPRMVH